ncbi:MAG: hypothetical protein DPW18_17010 [Chloroflexi bacterium]|nr:hypothetical protein [Chloroflexota bacterium]MDL1942983.1 hypothetical protein [Chloroflexi bacterium CFX2]
MNIAARDGVYIYAASSGSLWAACAFLEQQGDYYSLSLCGVNDPGGWFEGSPVLIVDEWQAASAPGANDGFLSLWIDGVLAGTISNVDNDTHALDEVRLGATGGVDSSTSGSMFFDSFESQRETYIGP